MLNMLFKVLQNSILQHKTLLILFRKIVFTYNEKKLLLQVALDTSVQNYVKYIPGYSWNDSITVIDNRFISERVNQLRNWNINFVHGDILDSELVKKYCKDADIVHHLAGITSVPRVKSESSEDQEKHISELAQQGTQNILDAINDNCKIIMPSTHVVYEGLESVKKKYYRKYKNSASTCLRQVKRY